MTQSEIAKLLKMPFSKLFKSCRNKKVTMPYQALMKAISTDGLISKSKDKLYFPFTYRLPALDMVYGGNVFIGNYVICHSVFGVN